MSTISTVIVMVTSMLLGVVMVNMASANGRITENRPPIPAWMWRNLSRLSIAEFVDQHTTLPKNTSLSAFDGKQGLSADSEEEITECEAVLTMERLTRPDDPAIFQLPPCIQVLRCSGCCSNEGHECRPVRISHSTKTVLRTALPYAGARKFETIASVELNIVSHLSCQCACRIQPDQCDNDIHTYDADSCRCQCRDTTEPTRCPSHKLWDHQLCRCVCPNLTHCVDGQHFSTESCFCEAPVPRSRVAEVACRPPAVIQGEIHDPCARFRCPIHHYRVYVLGSCKCINYGLWNVVKRRSTRATMING